MCVVLRHGLMVGFGSLRSSRTVKRHIGFKKRACLFSRPECWHLCEGCFKIKNRTCDVSLGEKKRLAETKATRGSHRAPLL